MNSNFGLRFSIAVTHLSNMSAFSRDCCAMSAENLYAVPISSVP